MLDKPGRGALRPRQAIARRPSGVPSCGPEAWDSVPTPPVRPRSAAPDRVFVIACAQWAFPFAVILGYHLCGADRPAQPGPTRSGPDGPIPDAPPVGEPPSRSVRSPTLAISRRGHPEVRGAPLLGWGHPPDPGGQNRTDRSLARPLLGLAGSCRPVAAPDPLGVLLVSPDRSPLAFDRPPRSADPPAPGPTRRPARSAPDPGPPGPGCPGWTRFPVRLFFPLSLIENSRCRSPKPSTNP